MTSGDQFVLVTGANSGLGLNICSRLIDDFLTSNHESSSLTIIFTTRSTRKGTETLATLEKTKLKYQGRSKKVVNLRPENVELTSLLSVRALARALLSSDIPHLNSIVLNAGIGSWIGLNWPQAVWDVFTGIRQNTCWPRFKLGTLGRITEPQFPSSSGIQEPTLGETFCANVFGHYMLVHYLMPLFHACPPESPAKIIWESSIEASAEHYNPNDLQALATSASYEHTKRMSDLLALTAEQPAVASSMQTYLTPSSGFDSTARPSRSSPSHCLAHPGCCTTTIISLYAIVHEAYRLGIYLARWCGSPWANVSAYIGALACCWLVLATPADVDAKKIEAGYSKGNVKWGSSCDRFGNESLRVTDVEGWGVDGTGEPFDHKWWGQGLGRKFGSKDATPEQVEDFIVAGKDLWKNMEALRLQWEALLDEYEGKER